MLKVIDSCIIFTDYQYGRIAFGISEVVFIEKMKDGVTDAAFLSGRFLYSYTDCQNKIPKSHALGDPAGGQPFEKVAKQIEAASAFNQPVCPDF